MTAESLARSLQARKNGSSWMAKCPAHDDRDPSLSIDQKDGQVLVHCHAGCSQTAVVDALKGRGLWEQKSNGKREWGAIVATYDYHDEAGKLLYQICRTETKEFPQRYYDKYGNLVWKKHPRQVLYRLPAVLAASLVFLVEGEKDADTLISHGFVGTTNAGGAGARWEPSYAEALKGREVVLIPDNDEPGRSRVLRIARELSGLHPMVLELNGGKDVTDWFGLGHSETELVELIDGTVRQ